MELPKRKQVTPDFTNYLRKNFSAIAGEDNIAFTTELEHTKTYLAVEQAQHEDMLIVEYDTPVVNFRLPPLTLQPLVKNAVKHGMNPNANEPLKNSIKTQQTDAGIIVTVEDTGVGIGTDENNEPHIALANIKERLKMICDGTLKIAPREGGGTVVTVTIPQ